MLAVSINSQVVFSSLVQGLAIAVIAVGVVLVYRATRIMIFAVGNMGVVRSRCPPVAVGGAVPRSILGGPRCGAGHRARIRRTRRRHGDPPPAEVAPGGRPRRHYRCGTGRGGDCVQDPDAERRDRSLPECDQRHVDGGRRAGQGIGYLDPDHRAHHLGFAERGSSIGPPWAKPSRHAPATHRWPDSRASVRR